MRKARRLYIIYCLLSAYSNKSQISIWKMRGSPMAANPDDCKEDPSYDGAICTILGACSHDAFVIGQSPHWAKTLELESKQAGPSAVWPVAIREPNSGSCSGNSPRRTSETRTQSEIDQTTPRSRLPKTRISKLSALDYFYSKSQAAEKTLDPFRALPSETN